MPSSLRFYPSLKHSPTGLFFPAMVAMVSDYESNFLGLHRTYLSSDGSKATIIPNKMMLGHCAGGFVEISNPVGSEILAVGEGIETCLAVAELYPSFKVFSVLSTSGMKRFELPQNDPFKKLVIIVDGDKAGYEASQFLAKRTSGAGWKVRFLKAPEGKDFNDVLIQRKTRKGNIQNG